MIGSGEMLQRPRAYAGTCGVLRWDEPASDILDTIFGYGIGHLYGIMHGDHEEAPVALASQCHIPVVRLGRDGLRESSSEPTSVHSTAATVSARPGDVPEASAQSRPT